MRTLWVLVLFFLGACATPNERRQAEFDSIKVGMTKFEVIDKAGPPHWSDRWKGHDRWMYYMVPDDRQTERVVYFKEGQVVLTGERIQPLFSAEEVEEIKKPRVSKKAQDFKPTYNEEQLREVIKKEIEKENKGKKQPQVEEY